MMKRHRKLASAVTLLLCVMLLVAGCSGGAKNNAESNAAPGGNTATEGNTSDDGGEAGNAGETDPAAKKLDPYEVVMVFPDNPQKDVQSVSDAMSSYLQEKYPELNMTVKLVPIDWASWADKTNLMFASNEKFDLIHTASWNNFEQQVNKGALLPLDDLLAEHGPDILAVEGDYLEPAKRGGKLYGIHVHQELGGFQGIAMRKDLVDKHNIDLSPLKSGEMKDLTPILKTIKENEPGVTPVVGPNFPLHWYYMTGDFDMIVEPVGLYLRNENPEDDFKVVSLYDTPRYMELAKLTHEWFKAGYVNQDATTPGLDPWTKIKAGTAFSIAGGDMEIVANNEIGAVSPMPGRSALTGREIIQIPMSIDGLRTGKMTATMQSISKTSQDPARAMMLLNLFYKDKELLTLFNFGVEGKHYVMQDGQIALPEGKTSENVGYYHDNMWQIGNQMLNYTRVGEDKNRYENYEKFNELTKQKPSKMLGFVFDSQPVTNELVSIANVRKKYDIGFQSGQLDPEKHLAKYQQELKAAGIDRVIAEAQKQLDAWRAANGK